MTGYTRGAWRAKTDKDDRPSLLYYGIIACLHHSPDPDGYVAVVTDGREIGADGSARAMLEECQANARLIAAAPAMFEALQRALPILRAVARETRDDEARAVFDAAAQAVAETGVPA